MRLLTLILPLAVRLAVAAPYELFPKEIERRQTQTVDDVTLQTIYNFWVAGRLWQYLGEISASECVGVDKMDSLP
jgi:hypothetical protein